MLPQADLSDLERILGGDATGATTTVAGIALRRQVKCPRTVGRRFHADAKLAYRGVALQCRRI